MGSGLDCHDREALGHVETPRDPTGPDIQTLTHRAVVSRFGEGGRPEAPIQWLSDNGSIYTALETLITAERLHLVPITTPAASPQSNGMSEAFVNTLRRDYLAGADLSTAARVLEQVPGWFADYNAVAPHSAPGYQSPHRYRGAQRAAGLKCSPKLSHESGYTARGPGVNVPALVPSTLITKFERETTHEPQVPGTIASHLLQSSRRRLQFDESH